MSEIKASLGSKGEGRKLRRARNVVRRWLLKKGSWEEFRALKEADPDSAKDLRLAIDERRYERAQVLLVTAALLKD